MTGDALRLDVDDQRRRPVAPSQRDERAAARARTKELFGQLAEDCRGRPAPPSEVP